MSELIHSDHVYQSSWRQPEDIDRYLRERIEGYSLNVCVGESPLGDVTLDADKSHNPDVVADMNNLPFPDSTFETVVFDPPFSSEQADSSYDGVNVSQIGKAMRQFDTLLSGGGRVIQMGFTTTCMPGSMDYHREEVAIFNTLGRMNDWLGTVDRRMSNDLGQYEQKKEGDTE